MWLYLEYPVIYVFLPSHGLNFEVVKDCHPVAYNPVIKDSATNGPPSPEGVLFREDEIEAEDSSLDTRAVDFMNYDNSSDVHRSSKRNKSGQTLDNSSSGTLYLRAAEVNISPSNSKSEVKFGKTAELEELRDFLDANGVHSVEEELEEGEIAE